MTLRAVILGLVGAAAVCGVTYLNDNVIRQTFLIGNHLPIAVYGVLMIFLPACNPLLRRLKGRFAARRGARPPKGGGSTIHGFLNQPCAVSF